ncbi:unnamed protein product [Vitrella brassicaformis CCMP3155]|uniref:Uncharacterized protein n=1 Tax=Vitrella brassicaformis (strain CCMP3155) TaxID=1169540 RepID=A0A0G4H4H7_VITBC|nr:unnamed protein product [Vitrella brassicaformis CCMP3155]|eukprot:CEM38559.1 unnamed protein product [Vitrella brassicaformis CCMP3155]
MLLLRRSSIHTEQHEGPSLDERLERLENGVKYLEHRATKYLGILSLLIFVLTLATSIRLYTEVDLDEVFEGCYNETAFTTQAPPTTTDAPSSSASNTTTTTPTPTTNTTTAAAPIPQQSRGGFGPPKGKTKPVPSPQKDMDALVRHARHAEDCDEECDWQQIGATAAYILHPRRSCTLLRIGIVVVVLVPISALRPGQRVGRRAMKGIVTRVSPVKAYGKNVGTQGRVFSMLLTTKRPASKWACLASDVLEFAHHPMPSEESVLTNFKSSVGLG